MVSSGTLPIPPTGWGGIEEVIWEQKEHLEVRGHTVTILNKGGLLAALMAQPWKYDIVHLQKETLVALWAALSKIFEVPLLFTPHHGYAAYPEKWFYYFSRYWPRILRCDYILALSPIIERTFRSEGYKGNIWVLPNGINASKFRFEPAGNGRAICLGKIQPRKHQAALARLLSSNPKSVCDFVGPIADPEFHSYPNARYLGEWTREQVRADLTSYSCLILASDGEAHPLVIIEALAAGLSVVVSPQAAVNLDQQLPWVYVRSSAQDMVAVLDRACKENKKYRGEIQRYAKKFDWAMLIPLYEKILKEVVALHNNRNSQHG